MIFPALREIETASASVVGGGSRLRDGRIVMQRKHNKVIVPIAKVLRKNMTRQEKIETLP